jgi:hypothetical protein
MFSESKSSVEEKSNVSALRLEGELRVDVIANEEMSIAVHGRYKLMSRVHTVLGVLEAR